MLRFQSSLVEIHGPLRVERLICPVPELNLESICAAREIWRFHGPRDVEGVPDNRI